MFIVNVLWLKQFTDFQSNEQLYFSNTQCTTGSNYNLVLINPFIELLQFLNNEKFINQFELDDIERLYDSLLKFKFIEYYIEASYFIWAVQDKKDKALKIAEIGLKLIEKKRCEMKELIYKIENE